MYYVYALQSLADRRWVYIGCSDNLRARFDAHQSGRVHSTKARRPLRLVYYEAYRSKEVATKREVHLKTGQQRELLKERLAHSLS